MPMRRPVKEPGPAATAKRSTSRMPIPAASHTRFTSAGSRCACVRVASPSCSWSTRPSRTTARLPVRVVVSTARISTATPICSMLYSRSSRLMTSSASSSSIPLNATPAMRQYFEAKRQHRDAIVFFRMGDFYEMFYEDALTAARALELTLTSRSKDSTGGAIPMCGVPFHAADGYIARLVRKGFRVAVVEQVEDPKKAKGLVRREVVRVVSPGTLTDSGYLDAREPAFLMAIAPVVGGTGFGVALLDVSTGEFTTAEYTGENSLPALLDELAILRPREIVA